MCAFSGRNKLAPRAEWAMGNQRPACIQGTRKFCLNITEVSELCSSLCLPEVLLSPALPSSCGWVVPELLTVRTPAKLPRGFLVKMNKVASGKKIFAKVPAGFKSLSAHPSP